MRYLYYPGCSAEATGKAYDISTRALMEKPGVELSLPVAATAERVVGMVREKRGAA